MAPRPMPTSTKPWYWVSSAPLSATSPFESMRPSTLLRSVLMPWARAMLALAPVARSEQPHSVPKNQYKRPITAMVNTAKMRNGLDSESTRALRAETSSG